MKRTSDIRNARGWVVGRATEQANGRWWIANRLKRGGRMIPIGKDFTAAEVEKIQGGAGKIFSYPTTGEWNLILRSVRWTDGGAAQ